MLRSTCVLMPLLLLFACGCGPEAGSQQAAEKHLAAEIRKWQAGEKNDAIALDTLNSEPPIGFEIYNTSPTSPSLMASTDRSNPAYQIKVKTTWVSNLKTQLTRSHTYVLTWIKSDRRWHIER